MKDFEDSTAEVANAAQQFLDDHRMTLIEAATGASVSTDDRAALREDLHQLDALIGARQRKQEAFLRAVAGAPELESKPASRENNDCNGSGPHTPGEVRVLPTGGGGNDILCRSCWARELQYRRERNVSLRAYAKFDLLPWESAKVYDPGE
jgi:hypothetical protein